MNATPNRLSNATTASAVWPGTWPASLCKAPPRLRTHLMHVLRRRTRAGRQSLAGGLQRTPTPCLYCPGGAVHQPEAHAVIP